ncbi:ectodysplasin-A [Sarotherodon galilaeus]
MNLYKSFGNLMETWVTEEDTSPDSEWLQRNAKDPPTPSSEMETNGRSESVDSGVETASCDTCFRGTSSFASTEIEGEDLTPALTAQSPVFSSPKPTCCPSSSLLLCSSSARKDSTALHLKLEQALQRTESMYSKGNSEPPAPEEMLSRRPQQSCSIKRHTSELVRGQRSDRLDQRRTVSPPVSIQPMSEMCTRTQSMISNRGTSEGFGCSELKELSPGFIYLEQVCQKLEDIAKQQMENRALQMQADVLVEQKVFQVSQTPDICQTDSVTAEKDLTTCQSLEDTVNAERVSSEPKQRKYGHFRQRSASDTTLAMMHLKKVNADCRGQHMSTHDLLEEFEEDQENQESTVEETKKPQMNWRKKILSLRREGSTASYKRSQQMQPSEKNSTRRRLSQLFKRKDKTV